MAGPKRTEITWEDSWLDNDGWTPRAKASQFGRKIRCRSLGYVIREGKRGVVLAGSLSGPNVTGVIYIPATAIRKRRDVK